MRRPCNQEQKIHAGHIGFETKNILGNGESVRVLSNSSDVRNTGCEEEKSRGGRRGMLPGRKRSSHAASRLSHRSKCLLPTLYFH